MDLETGGNAGTFNIDDVNVGSAANANIVLVLLLVLLIIKHHFGEIIGLHLEMVGSAPVSHIFDASFSNYCNNNAGGQIILGIPQLFLSGRLRIRCSGQAYYIYVNGEFILDHQIMVKKLGLTLVILNSLMKFNLVETLKYQQ